MKVMLRATVFALILAVPVPADRVPELRDLVASGRLSDLRRPDFSDYKIRVQSFYALSDYALARSRLRKSRRIWKTDCCASALRKS